LYGKAFKISKKREENLTNEPKKSNCKKSCYIKQIAQKRKIIIFQIRVFFRKNN
jgi:hypothetical protein